MKESIMIVVSIERKLEQNKKIAMSMLRGKLELIEEEKRQAEKDAATGGSVDRGWGSQIAATSSTTTASRTTAPTTSSQPAECPRWRPARLYRCGTATPCQGQQAAFFPLKYTAIRISSNSIPGRQR